MERPESATGGGGGRGEGKLRDRAVETRLALCPGAGGPRRRTGRTKERLVKLRTALIAPLPAALAVLVALLAACADPAPAVLPETVASSTAPPDVPYAIDAPEAIFEMPSELDEISGLTLLSNGHLAAVQDENGLLFEIDSQTGQVLRAEVFHDDGDYEGVEATADALWVLKSNGTLYELQRAGETGIETESFNTDLSGRNDAEGLGYDAAGNRLLIALKEHPGKGLGDVRAVYGFDLATRTLSEAPVFVLERDVVDSSTENFKPSAIAVRPDTGEIYVVSSVKKALLVVAPDGTILAASSLPSALFRQPEGLAFAPDGTLFVSNEAAGGTATVLRFSPR